MTNMNILLGTLDAIQGEVSPLHPVITPKTSRQNRKSNVRIQESNWRRESKLEETIHVSVRLFMSLLPALTRGWPQSWNCTAKGAANLSAHLSGLENRKSRPCDPVSVGREIVFLLPLCGKGDSSYAGQPTLWFTGQGTRKGTTGSQGVGIIPERGERESTSPQSCMDRHKS